MATIVEDVAHAYFGALANGKDASKIAEWVDLFADDAISADPVVFPPQANVGLTRDKLNGFLTGFFSNFQSIGLFERQVILNGGDSAAVQWEGIGVANNGQSITFKGIDVISVNPAGKIRTVYAFWNPEPVLKAIGVA